MAAMWIMAVVLMLLASYPALAQAPAGTDLAGLREADRLRTIALNRAARAASDRRDARAAEAAADARAAYGARHRAYEDAVAENRRARANAADAARDYAAARADYAREMAEWRARTAAAGQ